MRNLRLPKELKLFALIALLLVMIVDSADAQRRRKKGRNSGRLEIMENLPEFFVNDNRLPDYLKMVYRRDATRLALRLIDREQRMSKQTIIVPEELVQAIYNALVAVRLSDYGAIQDITSKYYVRTFPQPNVENIILLAEHDADWLEPLKRRADTTASPSINNIIRKYNLVMTNMVYLDEERAGLVLQSREFINMAALAMKFYTEEGIGSIEETLPYGDGNDISIERTKEGWDLVYSVKFGNCVNQCQKVHRWEFSIDEGGEVSYKGDKGHTIPPWLSPTAEAKKYPDVLKN
ncbi:hypothetical protein [Saprospira grandis]|uniref:hypothetical protein n=1 Tax=Saprospira grandis TaxID=1008 RepID=UPI0022DD3A31|nr:hypothetical protein [Saprospira grandis]WBM74805.1 hypothetical protein OP864_00925 [Saprospira grandis]